MKLTRKHLHTLLITLSLPLFTLYADNDNDVDLSDYSSVNISKVEKKAESASPCSVNVLVDAVGKAKIKNGFFEGDKIEFSEGYVEGGCIFYYCPAYKEGANAALRYTATNIKWSNNPWFEQQRFNTLSLTLTGFSSRLHRWFWRGQLAVNVDANQWNMSEYANYDALLWGRYEYCKNIGLHLGLIVQTGMQMDRVYPILGADWTMSKHWKLNLVFPVNVSLEYSFNKKWSVAIAGRNFNSRHRAGPRECFKKSLVRYQNVGAEFAIKYEDKKMSANIHAGTTLGGQLRISDQHNHHPHHLKLKPAPYAGAEVSVRF